MSNYLAQIAERSSGNQLAPAQAPEAQGMDDPFGETAFVPPVVPVVETTNIFPTETITRTVHENSTNNRQVTEIQPVYFSKYIERSHYHTEKETHRDHSTSIEHQNAAPISAATPGIHIENNFGETKQFTAVNQITLNPKSIENQSATIVLPGIDTMHIHKEPVFLQPQAPVQHQAQPQQKEKPAPLLVIGTITVEIIPAQKPVNKIINHVIKQPAGSASATAKKSNYGFGLGQL